MTYRFLGAYTNILPNITLESLGQKIDMQESAALEAMRGGCVMIPEAEYASLGISPQHEADYRYAGSRAQAPPELKARIKAGVAIYQKLLDEHAMGIDVSQYPAAPVTGAVVEQEGERK